MEHWVWITPAITITHAATTSAVLLDGRPLTWWEWPTGALIAGFAAYDATAGAQSHAGWAWLTLSIIATVAYAIVGINTVVAKRLPGVKAVSYACISTLACMAIAVATIALTAPHVNGPQACIAAMLPCAHAAVSITRASMTPGGAPPGNDDDGASAPLLFNSTEASTPTHAYFSRENTSRRRPQPSHFDTLAPIDAPTVAESVFASPPPLSVVSSTLTGGGTTVY